MTLADTLEALAKALPSGAIDQLTNHQRQLDEDGCFVGVSRQALDELLTFAAAALRERDGLRAHLEGALGAIDKGDLYDRMCCDGQMCGCQGSTHADQVLHFARAFLAKQGPSQ